jgi:hypothetical protein
MSPWVGMGTTAFDMGNDSVGIMYEPGKTYPGCNICGRGLDHHCIMSLLALCQGNCYYIRAIKCPPVQR